MRSKYGRTNIFFPLRLRRTTDKEKMTLKKRALSALNKALSDVRSGKSELRGKRAEKMAEEMETAMEKAKRVEEQEDDDASEETEKKNQVLDVLKNKTCCILFVHFEHWHMLQIQHFFTRWPTTNATNITLKNPLHGVALTSNFVSQLGLGIPACLRIDDDPHPFFPSARNCFEVVHAVGRGRHVLATRDIPAGTPLLLEEPVAAAMDKREFGSHCHHCFRLIQVRNALSQKYHFKYIVLEKSAREFPLLSFLFLE